MVYIIIRIYKYTRTSSLLHVIRYILELKIDLL